MHHCESILDAIETALTGLATTGANVARGRAYAVPVLPALTISKGADVAGEPDEMLDTLARELTIDIDIHTQETGNQETTLNAIAAEIYAALNVDYTLGLAYVYDCRLIGEEAPEIDGAQDLPIAVMRSTWLILYDHSKVSAEI